MNRHTAGPLTEIDSTDGADRAVVIGAGMAGLLAARVLADQFAQVVVLDRDTLPATPANRRNVPQGQHVHALLARGRQELERLFPGIGDNLVADGAMLADSRRDLTWYQQGGYHRDARRGLQVLVQSRPLIEHHVRRRVAALPNVSVIDGCQVTGLLASRDRLRVTGVRVATDDAEIELPAGLTVDASGRGSRLPTWLEALGYTAPIQSVAGVESRYATRHFRRIPGMDNARLVTVIVASPELRRSGVMLAQEGDRWLVTLSSRNGAQPPTELSGFIDWARSLEAPDIYEVVRTAIPLDDGVIYRFPQSTRRHYERLERVPAGLLPFGDAICGFNPVYAQGMTVAAIEAAALASCLSSGIDRIWPRFFTAILPTVEAAWMMAASGDMRYADGPMELPKPVERANRYMARVLAAAQRDPVVAEAFHRVTNLLAPPTSLRRPGVALRVAFAGRHGIIRQPARSSQQEIAVPAAD